jgi:hypothetical protein
VRTPVALALVVALAAVVLGTVQTWPRLHDGGRLSAAEAEAAPAVHEHLPVAQFVRWRARLTPADRWWLDVPPGSAVGLTNRGAVYRTFGTYWFLPALPAESPADATVVFHLRAAR